MDTPNRPNTFLDTPLEIGIAEDAMLEFELYCADHGLDEEHAMGQIAAEHMEHVRENVKLHKSFMEISIGGVFSTDVQGYDLAILDVMLPIVEQKRVVILTTINGAIDRAAELIELMAQSGIVETEEKPDGEPPILH